MKILKLNRTVRRMVQLHEGNYTNHKNQTFKRKTDYSRKLKFNCKYEEEE